MRVVDEKGKLFGLINVIDLSVLLLILLVIGAAGYKLLGVESEEVVTREVLVGVKCTYLKSETIPQAFKKGDRLVAANGFVEGAFIEDVVYTDSDYGATTADGRVVSTKHPLLKDALITIRAKIDVNSPIMKIGPQEIRIGANHLVKTQKAEAFGVVETITIQ